MKAIIGSGLAAAFVAASAGLAMAADRIEQAHSAPVAGELSMWVQGVIPTNTIEDGDECGSGNDDFCGGVIGFGGYAGAAVPVGDTWVFVGDLTIDAHPETDADPGDRDDHAFYGALGLHLVHDAGDGMMYGAFGIAAGGMNNEEDNAVGPVFGGGVEARMGNLFAQAGIVHYFPTNVAEDDTIETFYFGRVGGEVDFGAGMLEASVAVGGGDFDESRSDVADGLWVQAAAEYEAPMTDYINWFVGYQGDYVQIDDGSDLNQTFLHTIRGGITIPFGGEPLPFKTPNLRAPLTSAGEMN